MESYNMWSFLFGIVHLTQYFQDSSMLYQVSVLQFFLLPSNIPLYHIPHFIYPSISQWTFELLVWTQWICIEGLKKSLTGIMFWDRHCGNGGRVGYQWAVTPSTIVKLPCSILSPSPFLSLSLFLRNEPAEEMSKSWIWLYSCPSLSNLVPCCIPHCWDNRRESRWNTSLNSMKPFQINNFIQLKNFQ